MQEDQMQSFWDSSLMDGGNASYLEGLYEQYLQDPQGVSEEWRKVFANLPKNGSGQDLSHDQIKEEFIRLVKSPRTMSVGASIGSVSTHHEAQQMQVVRLINAYRLQGHLHAQIDPLHMREMLDENSSELSLEAYGLTTKDMATVFNVETFVGPKEMPLGELYKALNDTYCGSIGTEYMHIPSQDERNWIQQRIESCRATPNYSKEIKVQILERLTEAEGLEKYLGAKFPGAKRFSLEGGDSLIPMMDEIIQRAGAQETRECVIGMAHRGRLNVLINILGKDPRDLFQEFEGKHASTEASGDVKYHQGFSSDVSTSGGNVHLALAFNPSHLEIVTPVMIGSVRSRQCRAKDVNHNKVLPIAMHGDSAFSGQGVVMETLQMSQTRGYGVGGTLHIVINNQVGFTTSNPKDTRSTLYCTDVAKVINAPIFHVNADDPEAVVLVAQLALDYRMTFNKDVVVDLVCYRRHGHNEADDPSATQPLMYQNIKGHPTARQVYADQLIKEGVMTAEEAETMVKNNRVQLDKGESVVKKLIKDAKRSIFAQWSKYTAPNQQDDVNSVNTALSATRVKYLADKMLALPKGFTLHPRVAKIYEERAKMATGEMPMDWGFAETLAYASLLEEGYPIRMTGQDVGRGTFFHRHAVVHDQKTGEAYAPLSNFGQDKPALKIYDSLLSEEAVLGFEYGFSTADPTTMVIWEAQFGDFANGAQVVIDQFISSGEQKWDRLCGLSLFLPHGYEGQGPEHSSARLERFLQLCAQHNMQVCVPTTAQQVFHMIRRQMLRSARKPLIVMTPKSILRLKGAASELSGITEDGFQCVIPETEKMDPKKITRMVMCSGKVYFDLLAKRNEMKLDHVAIVRIEQLYPFPETELKAEMDKYPKLTQLVWCQEEPQNQGAWYSSQHHMRACMNDKQTLTYAGRSASASPATGYTSVHNEQQVALVNDALK